MNAGRQEWHAGMYDNAQEDIEANLQGLHLLQLRPPDAKGIVKWFFEDQCHLAIDCVSHGLTCLSICVAAAPTMPSDHVGKDLIHIHLDSFTLQGSMTSSSSCRCVIL